MLKTKKNGLGRGLADLFGDAMFDPTPISVVNSEKKDELSEAYASALLDKNFSKKSPQEHQNDKTEKVVYIPISDIKPNPKQARKFFNEEALEELASSIKEYGIIQPILLRPLEKGYEIVAGERRWRAATKAGLSEIPAIVRNLDDRQNAFYSLIENMQRENLNAMEEAQGLYQMMEEFGLTQQEAANAVGKSRPYVSNSIRLLKLPKEVQNLLSDGKLSAGHARAIAGLNDEALQIEVAKLAVEEGWTVRKIESYTSSKLSENKKKENKKPEKEMKISSLENKLREKLSTKVSITGSEVKGILSLEYYSNDELNEFIEILMK